MKRVALSELPKRADIWRELQQLSTSEDNGELLEKLAMFLEDVSASWELATQEQKNQLARCLFQAVLIKDKKVVGVAPQPEFKPFFDLMYAGVSDGALHWRPRGASESNAISLFWVLSGESEFRFAFANFCSVWAKPA